MLTSHRRKMILDMVEQNGQVIVQELSRQWRLSEDAVRRDLRELSRQGLLQRVHDGLLGIVAIDVSTDEVSITRG